MTGLLTLALQFSHTVYGLGEYRCGPINAPIICAQGAETASGEIFYPQSLTAAIPMPKKQRMRKFTVCLLNPKTNRKAVVRINDKKNPRYIGFGGLDLSPGSYKALTGVFPKKYSSIPRLQLCD